MSRQDGDRDRERTFVEQARRRQIVDAAIETLAEHGYVGASFARIAKRAGTSPSLIAYHFRSRSELLVAVARTIGAGMDEALEGAARAESYLAVIRSLVQRFLRHAAAHRSRMLALQQLALGMGPAERELVPMLGEERAVAVWQRFVEGGQEAGEFRTGDPRVMAVVLHGMLMAALRELFAPLDGAPRDVDRLAGELAGLVEHALRATTAD